MTEKYHEQNSRNVISRTDRDRMHTGIYDDNEMLHLLLTRENKRVPTNLLGDDFHLQPS